MVNNNSTTMSAEQADQINQYYAANIVAMTSRTPHSRQPNAEDVYYILAAVDGWAVEECGIAPGLYLAFMCHQRNIPNLSNPD